MNKEIPNVKIRNNYYKHNFIDSEFVEITKDTGLIIEMQYPIMEMKSAIKECLVRKEVLEKLLKAKSYLPEGITFKIWDAYRPLALQKELFYAYKDKIIEEFNLMKKTEEERNKIINSYVALPNEDETFSSTAYNRWCYRPYFSIHRFGRNS